VESFLPKTEAEVTAEGGTEAVAQAKADPKRQSQRQRQKQRQKQRRAEAKAKADVEDLPLLERERSLRGPGLQKVGTAGTAGRYREAIDPKGMKCQKREKRIIVFSKRYELWKE